MTYTIITAMRDILQGCQDSQLKSEKLATCQEALHFLTDKLHLGEFQAIVLSIVINHDEEIYTSDISTFLDIPLLDFLSRVDEIDELVHRKYLRRITDSDEVHPSYKIQKPAMAAFMRNEDYAQPSQTCDSYLQFMTHLKALHDTMASGRLCTEEYQAELLQLTRDNQQFPLCQKIKDMGVYDQIVYYVCAFHLVCNNEEGTPLKVILRQYPIEIHSPIMEALLGQRLPLLTQGIISFHNEEKTAIRLAPDICTHLQEKFHQLHLLQKSAQRKTKKEEVPDVRQIDYNTLHPKRLYYNPTERAAVSKLTDALQSETFRQVQERLQSHQMSQGLTCLFYGSPGTGKTATVYQIAHATHRHILQIDFAQIRSKWVGDSEKNIREFFAQYRQRSQKEDNLPLLLLNEADGLISRRITDIDHTHDKDENVLQNILLEEMEHFEGILIATTNLQDALDPAFERRFLYKVRFHQPSPEIRQQIWQSRFPEISSEEARALAEEYNFSGAQIENVTRKHLIENALTGETSSLPLLQDYCKQEVIESQRKLKPVAGFRR